MFSRESWRSQSIDLDPTYEFARRLVEIEHFRGGDMSVAIRTVARRLRIGTGTLTNILRKRVKGISGELGRRIDNALVSAINRQIESLDNELCKVRGSLRIDPVAVAEIAADITSLRDKLARLSPTEKL